MFSARPQTVWFCLPRTHTSASSMLMSMPPAIPASTPAHREPVYSAAAKEKNAPQSITPSMPILITPLFSLIISPSPA